jgi:Protein of unknown function (DUF3828)
MSTRRDIVLVAGVLALAGTFPGAGFADPAAKAFLDKIYGAYKGKDSKGIGLDNDTALRRYFEPGLAALMIKDRKDADRRGEVPNLDWDPFISGQDWEIGAVDVDTRDSAADKASATVSFRNFDMPTKMVFDLVKLKAGWRIADIDWGENGTLRGLYVKK